MLSKEIVVNIKDGLHARRATAFVKKVSKFNSNIQVEYNGKRADAKSLIGILSLGINHGAKIKLIIEGYDEDTAAEELPKALL